MTSPFRHPARAVLVLFAVLATVAAALTAADRADAQNEPVHVWLTTTSGSSLDTTLAQQPDVSFGAPSGTSPEIDVDTGTTYQTMSGFGAAMTDSAAYLIANSPQRDAIMGDLFGSDGIDLNMVRLPMGASDIARSDYSYDDMPAGQTDPTLANFSVGHDDAYIIPVLQQAKQLNGDLTITGTPWSAPGWMKIGGTFLGDCDGSANYLQNSLYDSYAQYFVKFIQAYRADGLPVDMVSMQNEPHNCNSTYPTMNMEPADQATFAVDLRQALDAAGLSDVRIMAWDHNWYENDAPTTYPQDVLTANGGAAADAVDAVGYHCYAGPTPGAQSVQSTFHDAYPGKHVYMTECTGGSWATDAASNFVWDMQNLLILPTRNWSEGSEYWSAALDPDGNPHLGGCDGCRGMVTVNADGSYTKNEDYYAWGHFSKFVRPGAVRVASTDLGAGSIETTAFRNPDGSLVLVALNSGSGAQTFQVNWNGQSFEYTLPANAATTFQWTPAG